MTYVLAFYEIDRAYGGPEEGGWWYDTGHLVRVFKVVKNEELAYRLCGRANRLLSHQQRYRRDVSSVCYIGGLYVCEVYEDKAPEHYPKTRPHYE